MKIGFVGNGSDKFTALGEERARELIRQIMIEDKCDTMVSGHSPVGGIDIWAEEIADELGLVLDLKIPEVHQWDPPGRYGYKARNLDIARDSHVLNVILSDVYPEDYSGRRFEVCYHHRPPAGDIGPHSKSGACYTAREALKLGKEVAYHVIYNY